MYCIIIFNGFRYLFTVRIRYNIHTGGVLKFIADFHIHSRFSIATSRFLIPEYLEYWARLKGIDVIGTGDCIHPGWLNELSEKLEPAEGGLYKLKEECRLPESRLLDSKDKFRSVFFMLTAEISNIYKKNGATRKVHNVCVFPDFESVLKLQTKLNEIGNIESDGRPILGLDSKLLLEMLLETNDISFLIPAHIWTPWFSVLGSKSGFDSVEECYEDLTEYIFAVETGLSTDPPMNWTCSFLDRFRLVSNSDAHSPEKLGREANLFNTDKTYEGIFNSLKNNEGFEGTIEFFPQEGKYHYDGHRKCSTCWNPLQTVKNNGICPVCGKPVTKGVLYRIAELADRSYDEIPKMKQTFHSITQMSDILAEIFQVKNSKSKKVQNEYFKLINSIGPEFDILLEEKIDEIRHNGGEIFGEAVSRLRSGNVIIEEGYDGEFGRVRLFNKEETKELSGRSLFSKVNDFNQRTYSTSVRFDINEFKNLVAGSGSSKLIEIKRTVPGHVPFSSEYNEKQREGICHDQRPCIVIAGPGSGKTRVLTERIKRLSSEVSSEYILALTFSNRAANEIRERLKKSSVENVNVSTFHSFGLSILKEYCELYGFSEGFSIADEDDTDEIILMLSENRQKKRQISRSIEDFKNLKDIPEDMKPFVVSYNDILKEKNLVDLNDLVYLPYLFMQDESVRKTVSDRYRKILVDEFQDINRIQYELLKLTANSSSPDLFVIGDPDQAIYGFRGAENRFMDQFKSDYPDHVLISLERGYRCPDTVMQAGSRVLGRENRLIADDAGLKIHVRENETDRSEADWIAESIEKMIGGVRSFSRDSGISDGMAENDRSFSDFAVLCRSAFMFESFINAFNDHGISYQIVNTDPFFLFNPYRDVISCLKKIIAGKKITEEIGLNLSKAKEMVIKGCPVSEILDSIMQQTEAGQSERFRLKNYSTEFGSNYRAFFDSMLLRRGADDYLHNSESVSLMTLHSSKGLEFPVVFIPGCEDGILPFTLFGPRSEEEIDEERRLLYVGITRTKEELFLSYSHRRHYRNRTLVQEKSRFLKQIEKSLIVSEKRETRKMNDDHGQLKLF